MIPVIIDKEYRLHSDGRQECLPTPRGRFEYQARREAMYVRQEGICACGCKQMMTLNLGYPWSATFQHDKLRGKDHDDRIEDALGNWLNCAMRYDCNMKLGSTRRILKGSEG